MIQVVTDNAKETSLNKAGSKPAQPKFFRLSMIVCGNFPLSWPLLRKAPKRPKSQS